MLTLLGRCLGVVGEAERERPVVGGGWGLLPAASGPGGTVGSLDVTHQTLLPWPPV